jgi:hypothetical protein
MDMTPHQRERAAQYCAGYAAGLLAAKRGTSYTWSDRPDQWKAGYAAGYRWGTDHLAATVSDLIESHRDMTS